MDWLTSSVDEHTVLWLLISSVLGGIVGSGVTFVYEDVLRPWLSFRRDSARLVKRYTTPLLRSAEALERRITGLLRNLDRGEYAADEYFRMSTLFVFADYLGLLRILEREFGFVPIESGRREREFQRRINGLFRAITSTAYFRGLDFAIVEPSSVPRFMCRAIGEAVTEGKTETHTMEFTEFVQRYGTDEQFRRWFAELDHLLRSVSPNDQVRRGRLVAAAANLRSLMALLDPRETMVRSHDISRLLEMLPDGDPVRAALGEELAPLMKQQADRRAKRSPQTSPRPA